ncbi:uracil-DNA glycosylase family protein [Erythrobacter sp. JK5]|uniref:uracil-DNA glycosylase family protein n=1 Tax=Erythrobacter sp. JK5 TaxID=2829500 RepID=UPI001BA6006A|nr:uracil-DNA glycosylase family protein [Erythrobacter sp. JK5]QUL38986.1 uracil-DNA glycosylase family protein [Erythrobacter sp. JK5]
MAERDARDDAELELSIRQCQLCTTLPLGPRPIFQWDRKAPILIAGQAPGQRTHQVGVPFHDPSGDRLRDWLGVDEPTFYNPELFAIVPMAFCFPGTAARGDLPPPPICAETWRERLLGRMENLRLTIIVGKYAAAWHLDHTAPTLTEHAAQWRETLPHAIVLPHPSPRNRMWLKRNPWFETETLVALRARVREIVSGED